MWRRKGYISTCNNINRSLHWIAVSYVFQIAFIFLHLIKGNWPISSLFNLDFNHTNSSTRWDNTFKIRFSVYLEAPRECLTEY